MGFVVGDIASMIKEVVNITVLIVVPFIVQLSYASSVPNGGYTNT